MKNCPNCNCKLYEAVGGGFFCKKCGYLNDPNYLKKKKVYGKSPVQSFAETIKEKEK